MSTKWISYCSSLWESALSGFRLADIMMNHYLVVFNFLAKKKKNGRQWLISALIHHFVTFSWRLRGKSPNLLQASSTPPAPPPNQEAGSILVLDSLAPDQLDLFMAWFTSGPCKKSFKSPSNQRTSKERNLHKISKKGHHAYSSTTEAYWLWLRSIWKRLAQRPFIFKIH